MSKNTQYKNAPLQNEVFCKHTKRVAEDEEAVIRVPVVLEIVRVQLALVTVPVEVRHVAVAVGVREDVVLIEREPSRSPPIEKISLG